MKIMKKSLLFLLMLIGSLGIFTSCNNDDEDAVVYPIDAEISGTYKGEFKITVSGLGPASGIPKNVAITKASDASIDLEINDFTFMNINLGPIQLNNCKLSKDGNTYKFTGKQTLKIEKFSLTADIDAQGTLVDGKIALNMDIAAKLGELDQAVTATYSGSRLKGNESKEAKILAFTIDSEVILKQPVIDETSGTIKFTVNKELTADQLMLAPVITISDKATVTPASGTEQNFSVTNGVKYTVLAEDGTMKIYTASIEKTDELQSFDFEDWTEQKSEDGASYSFYSPTGGVWDTSNTGVYLIKNMMTEAYPELADAPFAVEKSTDAHSGNGAAKISTIDSKGYEAMIPRITAGTLFFGYFNIDYAFGNPLECTRFGHITHSKPLKVTGYYKYVPGDVYYVCSAESIGIAVADESKKDACMVSAVLYEVSDETDGQYLDGTNIYDAEDRIVAIGQFSSDEKMDAYAPFTIELEYKSEMSADKKYRFALIASSSKDGNKFSGAPGSALYLDDIKVAN